MNTGWEEALEVQALLLKQTQSPFWDEMVGRWLAQRRYHYGKHAMLPSAHALEQAAGIIGQAEPIFITREMEDLTRSAMQSFNPGEEVRPSDFFLRNGMALLEKQYLAKDAAGFDTGWRAVTWRYVELPVEEVGVENSPSLEIILWWEVAEDDEWNMEHPEQVKAARQMYESWGMRWAIMHATLVPLSYMSDLRHMSQEGDPEATWLTFVRVFNRLMQERIVLKTRMRPHRAIRRAASRLGLEEVKDIVVCELRRARPRGYEWPETEQEVHYSHRFLVQGHWRNQWYPSEGRHKQKWISPYIKGPEDKPFVDKQRVWVWDR
ncbi:MAG TPA: hypothetical protein VEP28_08935 [Rubrobacter sp.]|nr:hypothetical protein [Rubrobacter sp.]